MTSTLFYFWVVSHFLSFFLNFPSTGRTFSLPTLQLFETCKRDFISSIFLYVNWSQWIISPLDISILSISNKYQRKCFLPGNIYILNRWRKDSLKQKRKDHLVLLWSYISCLRWAMMTKTGTNTFFLKCLWVTESRYVKRFIFEKQGHIWEVLDNIWEISISSSDCNSQAYSEVFSPLHFILLLTETNRGLHSQLLRQSLCFTYVFILLRD